MSSVAPWMGTRMTPGAAGSVGAGDGAAAGVAGGAAGSATAGGALSAGAGAAAGAGAVTAAAPPPSMKAMMSSRVTRPPAPEPVTRAMSTPCSAAIFRTSGVERVLSRSSRVSSPPAAGAGGAGAGAGAAGAGASEAGGARSGAASGAGAAGASDTAADASVSMRATIVLTSTVSPSCTRTSARTPAAGDGMSASTLSVEISNRSSSRSTASPTDLIQRVSVPSAMDSPICGMITSTLDMIPVSLSLYSGPGPLYAVVRDASSVRQLPARRSHDVLGLRQVVVLQRR